MMRRAAIIALTLATLPSIAFAKSSPIETTNSQFFGLFTGALLLAVILGAKGFDPVRIFYSWGVVTYVTFMIFVGVTLFLGSLVSMKPDLDSIYGSFLLLAGAMVVLIEALVLFWMTRIKFFWLREVQPLRFGRAALYSVIVNIASLLSAFLWLLRGEPLFESTVGRIIR